MDHHDASVHSRLPQRRGGRSVEEVPGGAVGVGSEPLGLQPSVGSVGLTTGGLVCHEQQQQVASFLLALAGGVCFGNGRLPSELGRVGGVCVSSNQSTQTTNPETERLTGVRNDSHRAMVGTSGLVPGSSRSKHRHPKSSSSKKRPLSADLQPSHLLPFLGDPPPNRLEALQHIYQRKGLDEGVSRIVSTGQRASTIGLYQTRWAVFRRWCRRERTSAFAMSIPLLLRFFRHLFENKELKHTTVVGYRAALRDFMIALDLPLVKHPLLTCFFSHYQRFVPRRLNSFAPRWCLNLVLHYLKSDVFEPLELAEVRALTIKTTFLVCFALSARTSELQGLFGEVCFGLESSSAMLTYDDKFWLKMENSLREVKRELRIPALSEITSEPEELLLCPVRALKIYCNRMRTLKANREKLFASPLNLTRSMSKNAITYMLKHLIIDAHNPRNLPSDFELGVVTNYHPREIRAISASLSFIVTNSMVAIRDATIWKGNTVFASHYLRERAKECYDESSNTFALRPLQFPVVAAQALVPANTTCSTGLPRPRNSLRNVASSRQNRERKDKRSKVKTSRRKSS